jgi:hypothetical protein
MFVQTFRSYFREEIFYLLCLNSSVMQVGVFPKAKTGKHKGEIKTHQRRKNWKENKSKQQKQKKQKCTEGASENLMQQSPDKLKESRKILNDGKAVLLMVPWVRVDPDSFIFLLSI